MLVQYMVGLCCLRHNPEAVDVTIGDMVHDVAAGKKRDVDVTVTVQSENGEITAFKAAEVKHEGRPIDVGPVEQLCLKLADMPKVTHKSIFSSSGYTDGAISKAHAHSVELFSLIAFDKDNANNIIAPKDFINPAEFLSYFETDLLCWNNWRVHLFASNGPSTFSCEDSATPLNKNGNTHNKYKSMHQFNDDILMRSTNFLFDKEPSATMLNAFPYRKTTEDTDFMAGPPWPHTHTLDVSSDKVYLRVEGGNPFMIESSTIMGRLQWRRRKRNPQFFILEKVEDRSMFASVAIADYGNDDGRMFAMIFSGKGRPIGIHTFQITEKHKNIIRNLKIK